MNALSWRMAAKIMLFGMASLLEIQWRQQQLRWLRPFGKGQQHVVPECLARLLTLAAAINAEMGVKS